MRLGIIMIMIMIRRMMIIITWSALHKWSRMSATKHLHSSCIARIHIQHSVIQQEVFCFHNVKTKHEKHLSEVHKGMEKRNLFGGLIWFVQFLCAFQQSWTDNYWTVVIIQCTNSSLQLSSLTMPGCLSTKWSILRHLNKSSYQHSRYDSGDLYSLCRIAW